MDDEIARAARARKGTPFLSTDQAAFYLGLSARKLQQMRTEGVGPPYRRHSRYIRYHIDDLDDWSRAISRQEQLARERARTLRKEAGEHFNGATEVADVRASALNSC